MNTKYIFWKAYFWIIMVLSAVSYVSIGFGRVWEVIDLIIFAGSITGLYGFCWHKQVMTRDFWKVYFPAQLIWNIYYLYFMSLPESIAEGMDMSRAAFGTINFLPYIPLMYALFLYTYYRDDIWGKDRR